MKAESPATEAGLVSTTGCLVFLVMVFIIKWFGI